MAGTGSPSGKQLQVQPSQLAFFSSSDQSQHELRRRHRHHGMVSGPFLLSESHARFRPGTCLATCRSFSFEVGYLQTHPWGEGAVSLQHQLAGIQARLCSSEVCGGPACERVVCTACAGRLWCHRQDCLHYRPLVQIKNRRLGTGIGLCRGSCAMVSVGVFRRFGWFAVLRL